jgi:hypothetical protein
MAFRRSTEIQSFLFDRKKWTVTDAKNWLKKHNHKAPQADSTSEYHRYRQSPPFQFEKGTFRTITIGASSRGIKAVIAVPKTSKKANPKKQSPKEPWVPTFLVDLATPISIDIEGGDTLKFSSSGKFSLGANRAGNELWIVSKKGSKKVSATDKKGEKLYEDFTGFEHDEIGDLVQIKPKQMKKIGRATAIVYRSDKFSREGDFSNYIHPFENYPIVSVDDIKRPSIVALRGGRINVKKEGITG